MTGGPAGLMLLDGEALRGDIQTTFMNTYQRRTGNVLQRLNWFMDTGVTSTRRSENYFYWESLPHVRRWRRDDEIAAKGIRSRSYNVVNFDWMDAIDWHENDADDDQTNSLTSRAQMLANAFAILPSRLFFQVLTATVDPDLLPVIPTAPDGVALFSALDGAGAARFGVAGGNIVAQTGTTSQAIRDDFFTSIERIGSFLDTEGQPFFEDEDLDTQGYSVLYPKDLEQQVIGAFKQQVVRETQAGATGDTAGVTNVILDGDKSVQLWSSSRLNGTDEIIVTANAYEIKPVFWQSRKAVGTDEADRSNSDRARATKIHRFQADARGGVGVNLPLGTVQIT